MKYNELIKLKQYREALQEAKREVYLSAFEHTKRNQAATARLLGVSRNTLRKVLAELV